MQFKFKKLPDDKVELLKRIAQLPRIYGCFFPNGASALPRTGKYSGKISTAPCNQENSLYFKVIW